MSTVNGIGLNRESLTPTEIPVVPAPANTSVMSIPADISTVSPSEGTSSTFQFDNPGDLSSDDFLVALFALKQQLRRTELESSRADILHNINLSSSEKAQLSQAADITKTAETNLDAAQTAADAKKKVRENAEATTASASNTHKQAVTDLGKANDEVKAAQSDFDTKKSALLVAGNKAEEAANAAKQAQIDAQKAAKAAKEAEGTPEEQEKKAAALLAEAKAEKAIEHQQTMEGAAAQAVSAVDNAKATLLHKVTAVEQASQNEQVAAKELEIAKTKESEAIKAEQSANTALETAKTAVNNAKAAEQSLIDSYQVMTQWVEKNLDTVISDMAAKDTTGAAAMLNALISSGSAVASALTAAVLQNSAAGDLEPGLSHSARMQLINQAAEREAISKLSEQSEKAVMKSEVSQDIAQLFVGIVAAFSVFGKGKFNEVAAINPGLIAKLADLDKSGDEVRGENSKKAEASLNLPVYDSETVKALVKNTMTDVESVFISAAELIQNSDEFKSQTANQSYRSVVNKV